MSQIDCFVMFVLDWVNLFLDMKVLMDCELCQFVDELCVEIISVVFVIGGYLGVGLGVVELIVVLYVVFDMLCDKIIWDVGYQCYLYKILIGWCDRICMLWIEGGLLGFIKCLESVYDLFGVGYSLILILVVVGFVMVCELGGDLGDVIVVIGDGVMIVGMVFEVMNNVGDLGKCVFVVLNDNEMFIVLLIGVLLCYLIWFYVEGLFQELKFVVKGVVGFLLLFMQEGVCCVKEMLKGMIVGGILFEELGFFYIGLVDGYDLEQLLLLLCMLKVCVIGLVLIYVVMKKGKGYVFVECVVDKGYVIVKFDVVIGMQVKVKFNVFSYISVFVCVLIDQVLCDDKIVVVMVVMFDGIGLNLFVECFFCRCFDVGIVE